jgi:hypothetical protein
MIDRREAALRHQAADLISPVDATRTASSRSASVKPRCNCSRAMIHSTKTPRFSTGTLANNSELRDQLIGPEYDYSLRGELQLEKKSDMKRRGLASPDIADALALTFARPVFPRQYDDRLGSGKVESDYDPIQRFEDELKGRIQTPPRYYAPGYPRLFKECD